MADLAMRDPSSLAVNLDKGRKALADATDDFRRWSIRKGAKAVEAAALVLGRMDIQVMATELIQRAEREIAKNNPPAQGERTDIVPPGDEVAAISLSTLRNNPPPTPQEAGAKKGVPQEDTLSAINPEARQGMSDAAPRRNTVPQGDTYDILLADPPWLYSHAALANIPPDRHYRTMDTDSICAMDIASLAADDSLLLLWATSPKLPDGLRVMREWGFEYRTSAVWHKTGRLGLGYWLRIEHELLLVGVKGSFPPPDPPHRRRSVFRHHVMEHSRKPDWPRKWMDRAFPESRRIEIFARSHPSGWDAWGDEAKPATSLERWIG